jgi:hypothetical protein
VTRGPTKLAGALRQKNGRSIEIEDLFNLPPVEQVEVQGVGVVLLGAHFLVAVDEQRVEAWVRRRDVGPLYRCWPASRSMSSKESVGLAGFG